MLDVPDQAGREEPEPDDRRAGGGEGEPARGLGCTPQSATPPLPFRRIPADVKDGEYDDLLTLGSEVDGVRKASHECSAHPSPEIRVLQWSLGDPVIGGAQFVQELQAETWLLALVPIERR